MVSTRKCNGIVVLFLFLCSILCGIGFFDAPVHASSSISLSLNNATLGLDLSPHGGNGAFAKSNNMTIDVVLSGPGGYTVGIQSSGTTDLVKQGDSSKKLESITTSVSEADFSANTSTAATNYNGKWGYLPNKYDSVANTTFRPAPSSEGDVFDVTHGTNDEGTYTIALGARGDLSLEAGTYTNTFVITAVSNYSCSVGEICYYDNEADGGVMENQSIPQDASEVELVGDNYYRTGYGFAGWSETMLDPDDSNFFNDFEAATVYGPMETVTIPNTRYMELYAVWVPSQGNLQGWSGCSSMSTGEVIALTDTRDGNASAIAKLADGNSWMMENMRLSFDDEDVEITNLNTNHPTNEFMMKANAHPGSVKKFTVNSFNTDVLFNSDSFNNHYAMGNYYSYYTRRAGNSDVSHNYDRDYNGDMCPAGWQMPGSLDFAALGEALSGTTLNPFTPSTVPSSEYMNKTLFSFPNNLIRTGFITYSGLSDVERALYSSDTYYAASGTYDSFYFLGLMAGDDTVYARGYFTTTPNDGFVFRCLAGESSSYTLSYDANGGSGAPSSITVTNTSGLFSAISNVVPTRNGYSFMGWVDEDGIEVQPGGAYNAGVNNTDMTLYAMWKNNSCNNNATTIDTGNPSTDAVCLQDVNSAVKGAMLDANNSAGSIQTYSLMDGRDEQNYTIALLDDGNVWMTKNLNLGGSSPIALSRFGTNLSNSSFVLPASNIDSYEGFYNGEMNDGYYDGVYYGGYYNWSKATASDWTGRRAFGRSTSICPSGWNLPSLTQAENLISNASSTDYAGPPYNFSYGGFYYNDNYPYSFKARGTAGQYWTITQADGVSYYDHAMYYYVTSSNILVSNARQSNGRSVRCVLKDGNIVVHYDGNGSSSYPVTGLIPDQTVDLNTGRIAYGSFLDRYGYVFQSWNTEPDGSGTAIASDAEIIDLGLTAGDEITLYAQWTPQLMIIYNDNYSNKVLTRSLSPGVSTTIGNYNYFTTKTGYSIKEWNTEPDGSGTTYAVNSIYTAPSDMTEPIFITLYAQWVEDYVITFVDTETNETQTKNIAWSKSGTLTPSTAWDHSGYSLSGWDTVANAGLDAGGTVVYQDGETITPTSNMTLYTVWKPIMTIQYDGNGATGTTTMAMTHTAGSGEEITLYASNFSRSGYGFVGWSFDSNAANDLTNAVVYGPNETIEAPVLTTPGEMKTLYAVWLPAESGVTMQTFDSTVTPYDSYPVGKVIALTDSRDNDTYAVAKLEDGKWWMIENYRLGSSATISLNTSSTAVSSTFTLPASTNSFSSRNANTLQIYAGSKINTISSMVSANSNVYSYGTYYSWNVAIGTSTDQNNTTVTTSICPYGWHLPTGGTSGEFANLSLGLGGLTTTMDSNTTPTGAAISKNFRAYPNNFILSGSHSTNSSINSRGMIGRYWSSTTNNGYANHLSIANDTVMPDYNNPNYRKYLGFSIRCIAD